MSVNECLTTAVCTNAGQQCTDADTAQPNNWVCSCIAPLAGRQTAGVATCSLPATPSPGSSDDDGNVLAIALAVTGFVLCLAILGCFGVVLYLKGKREKREMQERTQVQQPVPVEPEVPQLDPPGDATPYKAMEGDMFASMGSASSSGPRGRFFFEPEEEEEGEKSLPPLSAPPPPPVEGAKTCRSCGTQGLMPWSEICPSCNATVGGPNGTDAEVTYQAERSVSVIAPSPSPPRPFSRVSKLPDKTHPLPLGGPWFNV
eukprot:TRINITY_DN16331_c5_g1_i1.p1 TRINITY_DN16331_c5_g1~~TRINITY_DN16331_c5_g1_i1.p1  ORF type:complete len:259 (+),score=36.93 TRINITY_DN16331_c5_g1_i1:37-813(+)